MNKSQLDIVIVIYNSQKWIEKCIESISKSEFDCKLLNLFFVDNSSSDESISILNKKKLIYKNQFGAFEIISSGSNIGFGKASNMGALKGQSPLVFFLNIDTEIQSDSIDKAIASIDKSPPNIGAWEMRQFPYESPKNYDPITLKTSWNSAAALIIKREVFEKTNGFDPRFFMYAEDVELSWHIKALGYDLMYLPSSIVVHHSYASEKIKPNQYVHSIVGSLYLRYKYGSIKNISIAYIYLLILFLRKPAFAGAKWKVLKVLIPHFMNIPTLLTWNIFNRNKIKTNVHPIFNKWDYEIVRRGSFYENKPIEAQPLVSIIVRTHKRPLVLMESLASISNQTYKNIEIIIIEDGADTASEMISQNFKHLNYNYFNTEKNVGRCVAGNIGLSKSTGKYLCFLDDDDLIYSDHIEVLVANIEGTNYNAVYTNAFETPIEVISNEPYKIKIHDYKVIHNQGFNKAFLCYNNYLPIQTILFKRELYDEYGGFDERLNVLEDWDLWLRYAQNSTYRYVDKTTSIYRVPFNKKINASRQLDLDLALPILRAKHKNYTMTIAASDLALDTIDIVKIHNDIIPLGLIHFLRNNKLAFYCFKMIRKLFS